MSMRDASAANAEMESLYADEMKLFRALVKKSEDEAVDVKRVSSLLRELLTCASPRARYVVGTKGVGLQMKMARILPDKWLDFVIAKEMGVRPKG
jgi:hypothetical protein